MSTPDGRCGGQPDGSGRRPPVLRNGLVMGICIQDVIDGMKLQPCNPNFLQARDAILLADENNYAGRNVCRWWRGLFNFQKHHGGTYCSVRRFRHGSDL